MSWAFQVSPRPNSNGPPIRHRVIHHKTNPMIGAAIIGVVIRVTATRVVAKTSRIRHGIFRTG